MVVLEEVEVEVDDEEDEVVVKLKLDFSKFPKRNSAISLTEFSYYTLNPPARTAVLNGAKENCHIRTDWFLNHARSGIFEIPMSRRCGRCECAIRVFVDIANREANGVSRLRLDFNPLPILYVCGARSGRNP